MLKPFSLIFVVAVMVWFGAIFISSDPQVRMDRTCIPVEFAKRAATGGMGLVDDGWGQSTEKFFNNMHYGGRFVLWRMFFEQDWEEAQSKPAVRPADTGKEPAAAPEQPNRDRHIKTDETKEKNDQKKTEDKARVQP